MDRDLFRRRPLLRHLGLLLVLMVILVGGCRQSNAPESQAEPSRQATPSTPITETNPGSDQVDPFPRVEEPPVPGTGRLDFPPISVPAVAEDLQAPIASEPPMDTAQAQPSVEPTPEQGPVAEPGAPDGDLALRPNPLRDGHVPSPAHRFVSNPATTPSPSAGEPSKPLRKGKHSGVAFDPVKENGPIFQDWPTPQLALVVGGRQDGYLEPCGCAGLDRMKGGLSRRHTMIQQLRKDRWEIKGMDGRPKEPWPVVGVDVGGQCKTFGRQAVLKFQTTVDALKAMDFDAVAFGTNDLRLPAGEVLAVTAAAPGQKTPFLSANVALFGFAAEMTAKKQVVEAGGKKVGITSVLGASYQKLINNPDIEMIGPEQALASLVPELKKECDFLVLLAHATLEESVDLARKFPEFRVVVTAGGPPEPPSTPKVIDGTKTLLVEVGEKMMNAIVLGFYDDPAQPVRYQRVPLDSRFASSEQMGLGMANYQAQLRALGLDGLGIRPVPHPKAELLGKFVGSHKCESCHEQSYAVWKKSGHSKAWETLKNANPPRDADPECISCHVIGWHGQQFFPYESGFLNEQDTPKLIDVGCESCHGPGEKHCRAEEGSDEALQKKLQLAMRVTKEESEKQQCYTCHDLDNSPDFDFKTYWPYVEHKEE